jgi:arginase
VADHSSDGWDLIVTPWHLDEHIPAFPMPAGVTETICPALPAGPAPGRMTLLYQAVADAVARAARPLLLSGDCPTALGRSPGCSAAIAMWRSCGWTRTATSTPRP